MDAKEYYAMAIKWHNQKKRSKNIAAVVPLSEKLEKQSNYLNTSYSGLKEDHSHLNSNKKDS